LITLKTKTTLAQDGCKYNESVYRCNTQKCQPCLHTYMNRYDDENVTILIHTNYECFDTKIYV